MSVAIGAADFGAIHAVSVIFDEFNVFGVGGAVEAWPPCAGIKFSGRIKELMSANNAGVIAIFVMIPIFSAERGFSAALLSDIEFLY